MRSQPPSPVWAAGQRSGTPPTPATFVCVIVVVATVMTVATALARVLSLVPGVHAGTR
ncbi:MULTISPECIES: hypothetical protein [Rhodococcus]|uniref:hypothetical protein n=1 Tax=Rhodococcus TaxID=1827 RepID=UPI0012DDE3CF|nr:MULTISPECIES: hypothetical protein [Rhodococcus]WAM15287.1 hypothetical protein OYT95_01005 [Rhodococcus sp. JS3073]